MKVVILTFDFSGNCVGRSYLLAQLLQQYHKVKIIGPQFGEDVWQPLVDADDVVFKPTKTPPRNLCLFRNIREILHECRGDVIYATKPLISSFGLGMIAKLRYRIPLVLDIDDWELAPFMNPDILRKIKRGVWKLNQPLSYFPTLLLEQCIKMADAVTVASHVLKEKFGGTIIPHVRKVVKVTDQMRKSIDEVAVIFIGTPRPHKGIDDLIRAFKLITYTNVVLKIIGIDHQDMQHRSIISAASSDKRIQLIRAISFKSLKAALAPADIVVIPQRDSPVSRTQVPAKLFDAMAQGKAIISTRISDIPRILNDSGIIIEPGNITELRNAIEYLISHPEERIRLGMKAKERCRKYYSYEGAGKVLNNVICSVANV